MKSLAQLATLGMLIFVPLGTACAGSEPYKATSGTALHSCIGMVNVTGQGPVKNYFYTTGTFPAPNAETADLQQQWHDYLQGQHPGALVSLNSCSVANPDPAKEQANMQGWIDKYKAQATTLRTTWKFGETAASTVTPSAPPPAQMGAAGAADDRWFCMYGDSQDGKTITMYLTGLFVPSDRLNLTDHWMSYVRATYHPPATATGRCFGNNGHGRQVLANIESEAAQNPGEKLVRVDWKG